LNDSDAPILPMPLEGISAFSPAIYATISDGEHCHVQQMTVCGFGLVIHCLCKDG
jgi:hypothetical protein